VSIIDWRLGNPARQRPKEICETVNRETFGESAMNQIKPSPSGGIEEQNGRLFAKVVSA
jgi:hypothetical protein